MSFKSGPECQQAGSPNGSDTRVASGEAKLWREHTGIGRGKLPVPCVVCAKHTVGKVHRVMPTPFHLRCYGPRSQETKIRLKKQSWVKG